MSSAETYRCAVSADILTRFNRTAFTGLPPYVAAALRHIIERHGHVAAGGIRCLVCRQEHPCPDLTDALNAALGPEEP